MAGVHRREYVPQRSTASLCITVDVCSMSWPVMNKGDQSTGFLDTEFYPLYTSTTETVLYGHP